MTGWIEGIISILRCEREGHLTPHITFSADTDMVTMGLGSLSSITANEIVVADVLGTELAGRRENFQNRINQLLARDDLRVVQLRRVVAAPGPAGVSFEDFRRAYAPPRLVFECPHCGADAAEIREDTPSNYKRDGGTLTVLADLEIRD